MARTSAKAKKSKQEVIKKKSEDEKKNSNKDISESDNAAEETNDSTDKENDSTNYEIEKIIHSRLFRGKRQFLVRWKGFEEDSDTWENESAVEDCLQAVEEFKKENPNWENSSEDGSDDEATKEKGSKKSKKSKAVSKKTGAVSKKTGAVSKKTGAVSKKTESKRGRPKTSVKEDNGTGTDESAKESEGETEEEDKEKRGTKRAAKGTKKTAEKKVKKETTKKSDQDSDGESVTDGKNYEVDRILELHTRKDGSREFLIRWKGYKPSEDTWEPEAHLDCTELIEKFMEKVAKAKDIPARELRESKSAQRFIPYLKNKGQRGNVRNRGLRPCYQE